MNEICSIIIQNTNCLSLWIANIIARFHAQIGQQWEDQKFPQIYPIHVIKLILGVKLGLRGKYIRKN